jgi:hypothetical protein
VHWPTAEPCIHSHLCYAAGTRPSLPPARVSPDSSSLFRYSQDQAFSLLPSNRRFLAAMAAGFVTGLVIGGLLLSVIAGQSRCSRRSSCSRRARSGGTSERQMPPFTLISGAPNTDARRSGCQVVHESRSP